MRCLPALFLIALAIGALAACSAGAAPGWTYAPAASATPVASGAASGEPSVGPSVAPSSASSVAPSVAPSAGESAAASGGTGATLTVTAPVGAASSGFQPTTLDATANAAFTIHFDSQDPQPHNVQLKGAGGEVALGGDTAFFQGPGTRDYAVPALPAGTYTYYCMVHPGTMTGTLTAK
ncbi:MAG TPA: cupredoxin domain-containing protein [Candidatus Limnocylindrales bacterium]|nr:cupredoxin domain-containing protein [Candidatus Limnocylindrales bacterium]